MRRPSLAVLGMAALLALPAAGAVRRRAVVRRPPSPPATVIVTDDFRFGQGGWEAGFADYSPASNSMELESGIRPLPPELGAAATGFMISGHNRSDDLFMYLVKKLTTSDGIRPNQRYEVSYRIVFASNAGGEACGGIGGHPGFSVYMKAGALNQQPRVELDELNHFRLNADKGNQSQGGPAATVAGNISTGSSHCFAEAPYQSLELQHRHTFIVPSNAFGEIWLLVGTDSGFEGKTTLYYQSISARLTPVP